jgi:magnesium transporter
MNSTSRLPVPSPLLLRFLRSQSYSLGFLAPLHGCDAFAGSPVAFSRAQNLFCTTKKKSRNEARWLSTQCTRQTTSWQASYLSKGLLLSRSQRRASRSHLQAGFFSTSSPVRDASGNDSSRPRNLTWQERLWGATARRGAKPLKPDDLPAHEDPLDSNSMFNNRRTLTAKAALEPRLRCTEVDENGEVILVDGEFKKSELIAKVCPRRLYVLYIYMYIYYIYILK